MSVSVCSKEQVQKAPRNFTSSLTGTVDLGSEQVLVFFIGSSANYISSTVRQGSFLSHS